MLLYSPAVFAVGENYQIIVPVDRESLFWVRVGDTDYYDESNGVMRTRTRVHRVSVPMEELDRAGSYTVFEKEMLERRPYFPVSREETRTVYPFYPVRTACPRVFHAADVHNRSAEAILTARCAGPVDMMVMNGDVPEDSSRPENFNTIYAIAESVTHGSIPIVFARGNHDLRGTLAESIVDFIPAEHGNTYYTFRLGPVWGIVLDCGEDKDDDHEEYGGTVCCAAFRRRETAFIRQVIARAAREYAAEGVRVRLVVCHNPFVHRDKPPFDIETDTFAEWIALLREHVKPQMMLSGHTHRIELHMPFDGWDTNGSLCPVLVGTAPKKDGHLVADVIEFGRGSARITALNDIGEVLLDEKISLEE